MRKNSQDLQIDSFFLDSVGGAAWPFLVGEVICLNNSCKEQDHNMLNRVKYDDSLTMLLRKTLYP